MLEAQARWWQRGTIYQIYPWSFMDADGDGIGDLPGITAKLGELAWLGVDAVWISPIFPSPMADFGYDITDYCDIDPRFGTLADFDALLAEAHRLGLRVILDYVPNHTSDEHPWFVDARSSRDDPRRDWYIWRDPAPGGGPPTNWLSEFGGSAWAWDGSTGQYYYHAYLTKQPDLNWRNPEVQAAMLGVLRFWLDRGVDGFRVDTIHHLIKDDRFRDNPPNPEYAPGMPPHRSVIRRYTTDRPEVQDAIVKMRGVLDEYDDRVLIGEAYLPIERLMAYYGERLGGMHLPFNFQLIHAPWEASAIASIIAAYEAALPAGAWPNWVLGNHDRARIASRVGEAQARVAAMLLLTLRGTPTIYNGDEIGMLDVPIPPERIRDPWGKNVPGFALGRDPERTPMQWSRAPGAGFTTGTPWLPLGHDWAARNVEVQRDDPSSMLSLHRALLHLRRREPALAVGSFALLEAPAGVLAYARMFGERRLIVCLNFTSEERPLPPAASNGALLRSTHPSPTDAVPAVLRPNEGVLVAG